MTRNIDNPGMVCRRFALVLVLLLAACAHTPEARSPQLLHAIDFNQQGEKAFRSGEYLFAIDYFNKSLLKNESIENLDGIAINRINLAKSYQAVNNFTEAHRVLDGVLLENLLKFPDEYLAAAATQKSLLLLSQNEDVEAARWNDKAVSLCGNCRFQGTIFNVQSTIALRRKDAAAATHWGELGVKVNRASSPLEYANSLRLLARAKLAGNAAAGALPLLEEVLVLDKKLGTPEKISLDMNIMAEAYALLGEKQKSREYGERAKRVMEKFRESR
jgi:tetratricopeptide (TPR) repeat protein